MEKIVKLEGAATDYFIRSTEQSLAEIHQEMSELLDKQVNAQKEKSFQGSRKPITFTPV